MVPIGRWRWFSFATGFLVVVLTCAIVLVAHPESPQQTSPAQPPAAKPAAPPQPAPAGYVGDDTTCLTCHDSQGYKGTAHARAFNERTPRGQAGLRKLPRSWQGTR